tara:strand:- start:80514 stop:81167 length:654 start_codon:yes stop_codon:yes gene_type:complete
MDNTPIIVETNDNPTHAVIWLHGLGADGHDFVPIVDTLQLHDKAIRFVFPHAPVQAVTINGGAEMRAWYDILGLDRDSNQDEIGVRESEQLISTLIDEQIEAGIAAENISIAGFSQGGAMALHIGLRYPKKLAGIIALSTYLPLADHVETDRSDANQNIPIFMAHGFSDAVLPFSFAELSRDRLQDLGYTIDWHEYKMGHEVCGDEIGDLSSWLQAS